MTGRKTARNYSPILESSEAVPYDFQRPTTLAREHSRILDVAFETFARQASSNLTTRLRTKVTLTSAPTVLTTYDSYTSSLPSLTAMFLLAIGTNESRGVFQLPVPVLADWVSRMLGSDGEIASENRKLSPTEVGIARKTIASTMDDLVYSLTGVLDAAPVPEQSIHYNPGFAQAMAPTDLVIMSPMTLVVGTDTPHLVTVALPAELVLPRLGSANPVKAGQDAARLVINQLAQTPVEVHLEANHANLESVDLLKLQVGDLIPLNHPSDRPYVVRVDGVTLATATEVVVGSRKYMKIEETELNP